MVTGEIGVEREQLVDLHFPDDGLVFEWQVSNRLLDVDDVEDLDGDWGLVKDSVGGINDKSSAVELGNVTDLVRTDLVTFSVGDWLDDLNGLG